MPLFERSFLFIFAIMLLLTSVEATEYEQVVVFNQEKCAQWVNWVPASWETEESVIKLVDQISAQTETLTELPQLVHDWICKEIYYDWDAFHTEVYATLSASQVLHTRRGVCEGIANLAQILLLEAGIPCIKVWGYAIAEGESWSEIVSDDVRVNHTWNEYYLDGQWHFLDCTMDLQNSYRDGKYESVPPTSKYLDPSSNFFAETHLILQRGFDVPENIPSDWAKTELEQAIGQNLVPLAFFKGYHTPITQKEFYDLLGIGEDDMQTLTRAEAAFLLNFSENGQTNKAIYYTDIDDCLPEEQTAIAELYQKGIMVGDGTHFFPETFLTRQEAIIVLLRWKNISDSRLEET